MHKGGHEELSETNCFMWNQAATIGEISPYIGNDHGVSKQNAKTDYSATEDEFASEEEDAGINASRGTVSGERGFAAYFIAGLRFVIKEQWEDTRIETAPSKLLQMRK